MKKRKSPIAKNLMKNSISGMFSAIEIHNKPNIEYRYEMVVLLILNSWELLLKAYLYKFHKQVKLFYKDGTTKQFENCLAIVLDKVGKDFAPEAENLHVLYGYRNQFAHFYIDELDPIIFSLISKNVIFYSKFLKKYFKIDLAEVSNLILLPIGFKRPISPIDYISTTSVSEKSSIEVKEFLQTIIDATSRLNDAKIDETVFVDFKMNLTNVTRIKNADLIAGIDNSKVNKILITTKKDNNVRVSNAGETVQLSRDKSTTSGTLYYEELTDAIFDEINNVIDTNKILTKGNGKFILGKHLYYRIYSERQHVSFNIETYELLAETGMLQLYAPFLFWFTKLPAENMVNILTKVFEQSKSPNMQNLLKISCLLGSEATSLLQQKLDNKFEKQVQKPNFYYTFLDICKSKQTNSLLKALKATPGKILFDKKSYGEFILDKNLAIKILSQQCYDLFTEDSKPQSLLLKELDYIAYGDLLVGNNQLLNEIKNRF